MRTSALARNFHFWVAELIPISSRAKLNNFIERNKPNSHFQRFGSLLPALQPAGPTRVRDARRLNFCRTERLTSLTRARECCPHYPRLIWAWRIHLWHLFGALSSSWTFSPYLGDPMTRFVVSAHRPWNMLLVARQDDFRDSNGWGESLLRLKTHLEWTWCACHGPVRAS